MFQYTSRSLKSLVLLMIGCVLSDMSIRPGLRSRGSLFGRPGLLEAVRAATLGAARVRATIRRRHREPVRQAMGDGHWLGDVQTDTRHPSEGSRTLRAGRGRGGFLPPLDNSREVG